MFILNINLLFIFFRLISFFSKKKMTFYTNKFNNLHKSYLILPGKENVKSDLSKSNKNDTNYSPSQNEWYTSLYSFDKNYIRSLPVKNINTYKLLNTYFNMKTGLYEIKIDDKKLNNSKYFLYKNLDINENNCDSLLSELSKTQLPEAQLPKRKLPKSLIKKNKRIKKLKKKMRLLKKRMRFSVKKTFISIPQSKHLNHELIITVSIYNRELLLLKKKIFKIFKRLFYKKKILNVKKILKGNSSLRKGKINSLIYKHRVMLNKTTLNLLGNYNFNSNLVITRKQKLIKYYIYKKYRYLLIFKHHILIWCLQNYKFNNNNLLGLRNIVSKIYNKTPIFNLIKLKYFYLDSNIIASLITKKLRDRKKKVLIILKRALAKVKKFKYLSIWNGKLYLDDLLSSFEDENKLLNNNLYKKISNKNMVYYKDFLLRSKKDIVSIILYNTKNKILNGIRLQGGGRLTKRLTALRSVSKTKYVGSLRNINSSTLGLSTVMLRGYCKSNLQYTNINSYNRNGSFGVKTSIASF